MRMPRMQGRPPRLPGSIVIRDRHWSFIANLRGRADEVSETGLDPCRPRHRFQTHFWFFISPFSAWRSLEFSGADFSAPEFGAYPASPPAPKACRHSKSSLEPPNTATSYFRFVEML